VVEEVRRECTAHGKSVVSHAPQASEASNDEGVKKSRVHQLSTPHVFSVLRALVDSVKFARNFNADTDLRQRLWEKGFMRQQQNVAPELYYQEAHGLMVYLQILFHLYAHDAQHGGATSIDDEVSRSQSCLTYL
jgi:hypothetical protein